LIHFVIAGLDPAIHPPSQKFLRSQLDQIIDMKHALVKLAGGRRGNSRILRLTHTALAEPRPPAFCLRLARVHYSAAVGDDRETVNTGAEGKKGDSRMRIGTTRLNLRAVTGLSAAFGLALTLASLPAAAQQWTPKQRAACEPDAMDSATSTSRTFSVSQSACPITGAMRQR
jgi:hypothetical protein